MRETLRHDRLVRLVLWAALAGGPCLAGAADPVESVTPAAEGGAAAPPGTPAPHGSRRPLRLTQADVGQQGETLRFGAPAGSPPAQAGETLQLGTPPPGGPGLQFGAPPEGGGGLQIGAPPEGGGGLQIGAPPADAPAVPVLAPPRAEAPVRFSVPWVRAEGGWLPQSGSRADFSGYLSGAVRVEVRPETLPDWSLQATLRGDSYPQTGRLDDGTTRLDYGETFVRYDDARTQITVGAQNVLWGRVDEIPPTDRLGVQDITRLNLDELPDRRRAVPAVRLEHSLAELKLDAVLVPFFRPAELADQDGIWFPVRREDGRILGIRNPFPLYGELIRNGTIGEADEYEDFGGAGLRVSRGGAGFDAAATVQRARHSLPYYQLDPAVRAAILQGQPLGAALASGTGPTFREVHPLTWVIGADLATEALGGTVRIEGAWLSDVPVTTLDARLETHDAFDWVGGYEFFPGDGNTRVTLQLAGHHVFGAPITLDRTRIFNFLGELEVPFAQERWRFNTRLSLGLNDRDIYLNPKLSYVGWEPHEFYVGAHLFSGSQRTVNGFYQDNDIIVLGWRAKF